MVELTTDIRKKIESMLEDVKKDDPDQFEIIMNSITEIHKHVISGEERDVQKKLYNWIDDAAQKKLASK